MLILGIESSCDETAAAVMANGRDLLANVIDTQITIHAPYGGVVPELASRRHLETIYPVVGQALHQAGVSLADIDGLAVTRGPGLVGSLLVGFSFTKAVSSVTGIPYVGVDHMAGHLLSVFLDRKTPPFPYVALAVSGGHTSIYRVTAPLKYQLLGRTRDDAAGEAFDKVAKFLELGYPGGPVIAETALAGSPAAIAFPRAWLAPDSLDFSFSGVKTAVANFVRQESNEGRALNLPDICASFQEALVEVLVEKTIRAALANGIKTIALVGGVAANARLREFFIERSGSCNLDFYCPPREFCTDNAAMVALAGYYYFRDDAVICNSETDVYSRTRFDNQGFLIPPGNCP